MKNIDNFSAHLFNMLFENNGNMPIFFSERFRVVLNYIDDPISRRLLELENTEEKITKKTFVDIDDTNNKNITFLTINKIKDVLGASSVDSFINDPFLQSEKNMMYSSKLRSSLGLSKFVNQLFNNEYKTKQLTPEEKATLREQGDKPKSEQLELFVSSYKNEVAPDIIELVTGDDIVFWYDRENNTEDFSEKEYSCMADSSCSNYIEFYAKNENVSMLIMKDKKDDTKLKARAIVWKLSYPEDRYFMDKIYAAERNETDAFIKHAVDNNWLYKANQSSSSSSDIVDPSDGSSYNRGLVVDNMEENDEYPYLDTLMFYSDDSQEITNDKEHFEGGYYILDSTGGQYTMTGTRESYEEQMLDLYDNEPNETLRNHISSWDFWKHIDATNFIEDHKRDETSYYADDFDNLTDNFDDKLQEYLISEVDDNKIIAYIKKNELFEETDDLKFDNDLNEILEDEIDNDELSTMIDDMDLINEFCQYYANDRFDGMDAGEVLDEFYGSDSTAELSDEVLGHLTNYIDIDDLIERMSDTELENTFQQY